MLTFDCALPTAPPFFFGYLVLCLFGFALACLYIGTKVRECGGLAGCACPIEGEPEPHPVVPVAGENGCDNPQEGCGGHYCCGDTRCNLGRTCGGLHHCACPMFGGEPTTTAPPATLCNSVPIDCLDGIDLTVAGLTDECAASNNPTGI